MILSSIRIQIKQQQQKVEVYVKFIKLQTRDQTQKQTEEKRDTGDLKNKKENM